MGSSGVRQRLRAVPRWAWVLVAVAAVVAWAFAASGPPEEKDMFTQAIDACYRPGVTSYVERRYGEVTSNTADATWRSATVWEASGRIGIVERDGREYAIAWTCRVVHVDDDEWVVAALDFDDEYP